MNGSGFFKSSWVRLAFFQVELGQVGTDSSLNGSSRVRLTFFKKFSWVELGQTHIFPSQAGSCQDFFLNSGFFVENVPNFPHNLEYLNSWQVGMNGSGFLK